MKSIWHQIPLVRVAIAFMAGILLAKLFPELCEFELGIFIAFLVLIASIVLAKKQWRKHKYRYFSGILFAVSFLLGGILISSSHSRLHSPDQLIDQKAYYVCEVENYPSTSAKSIKLELEVHAYINSSDSVVNVNSGLLAYGKLDTGLDTLKPGDRIVFRSNISRFESPINPGQFDYGRYLLNRGIVGMVFLKDDLVPYRPANAGFSLVYFFKKLQYNLVMILKKHGMKAREHGVASALVLGNRGLVDPDIKSDFADAGVVHILAVSGLHVGIIYLVLAWVFNSLFKAARFKWLKLILVIALLWTYAGITGFSPSVMRAATMFSFVAIGQQLQKKGSIYNMLGVSALLLLLIQPKLLFEVGFQLSYIAVLGIALFYKGIYAIWVFDNWFADKTWSLIVVSFSAQLATFPLAVYYFDQFPNYFLLSNLIIIPLATGGLYVGLSALALSWVPWVDLVLLKLLEGIFWILNTSVEMLAILPFSKSQNLHLGVISVVVIYLLILFLFKFLESPIRWSVWWPIGCSILLICLFAKRKYTVISTSELVVLEGRNTPLPLIQKGENGWLYYSGSLNEFEQVEGFFLDGYLTETGIKNLTVIPGGESLKESGIEINDSLMNVMLPNNIKSDFGFEAIEIVGAANRNPPTSQNLAILSSQGSSYSRSIIKERFQESNQPYWDMKSQGVFSIQLSD